MHESLSPAKKALLEKWLQGHPVLDLARIPKRPQGSAIPVSFPQRRQLFLELLARGTAVNNLSVFLEFKGSLHIAALEESANKIVARHETLRTSFQFDQGQLLPVIMPVATIRLQAEDLQTIPAASQFSTARMQAEQEVLRPFDLTNAPLIRLKLYQLNEAKHLLLIVAHHAIADGWSLGVFLKELTECYRAITGHEEIKDAGHRVPYSDYAYWQAGDKLRKDVQASLSYWKNQLAGELPLLALPTDQVRNNRQRYAGKTFRFRISRELTEQLESISQATDATLFMTLLAAYFILLHRYSGQDDIIVGSPMANRNHPDLELMIGVFINPVALRVSLSGNPDFRDLLGQVRLVCLDAYAHQDLPFEKLVEELKPPRDLSNTPIFQAVFNMQNAPLPKVDIPGLETAFMEVDRGVSQFDLTWMITKTGGECEVLVEYDADLFSPGSIERMSFSYLSILKGVVADQSIPISRLRIIDDWERDRLVFGLNQTQADYPTSKTLQALFEEQAEKTPEAIAVIYDQQSLTYSALNSRANRLARHLNSMGVGPGTRVGIFLDRCLALPESLLGVLKAGGIYVPIHVSSPVERIQFIVDEANLKVVIGPDHGLARQIRDAEIISPDTIHSLFTDDTNPGMDTAPGDPAYIMYTSGSTGQPKGVIVPHSALVNFLWSMRQRPGITTSDILLSVTPASFDIAALELFLPLISGSTVVVATRETISNPILLAAAIRQYQVTMMQATPATWQLLVDTGWDGEPGLKALCGGEALSQKLAGQLLERTASLWNMYGPTETTIWSSACRIINHDGPVTIGEPVANTQLYILDKDLQPVPVGVIGELYIGGAGVALGYLKRESLTREKFIPDYFNSAQGARLFKTGDRARYLPDYSIEILGRNDDQVKVNGHRIELSEITSILEKHHQVQEAVTITPGGQGLDKRILAYYVPKPNTCPSDKDLRAHVAGFLPPYMIPSGFIRLDALPLTPHGKINRAALPLPEQETLPDYVAARNQAEQVLVSIWQSVLHTSQVGVHDNFFELGGASIQALEMVARANMSGIPLRVENIFQYQTIAELSAHIERQSQ